MSLRPLTEKDLSLVRAWRNAPEVRLNMYSTHEISEAEHKAWFARLKDNTQSRWFIYEDALGQPKGVIYFTQIEPSNGSAFWGFYVAPEAISGMGTRMGLDALDKVFLEMRLHKVNSEALAQNVGSIRFQKKLGFQEEGLLRDFHYNGTEYVDVVRLGILATEWAAKREEIIERIALMDHLNKSFNFTPCNSDASLKNYIVASCKSWHRAGFDLLKYEIEANWHWVDTPEQLMQILSTCTPRFIFFLHWNWFVGDNIWKRNECVCFHMTDVPYGRGGSPLQNLIASGHRETKLSALRMVREMDAGPVYTKKPLSLDGRAESIYRRAGELSFDVIRWMVSSEPTPIPQQGEIVSFKRRVPSQSKLPDNGVIEDLYNHIRMLDATSYPYAYIDYGEFRLEFVNASFNDANVMAEVKIYKIKS
jgi:UDP-4-amino-4,6-dideoxy-N-acetyl-beta-L-altrosamine N-acetyltransferase